MAERTAAGPPRAVALAVNPHAGGGKGAGACARVARALEERGVASARFETTAERGDMPAAARALEAGFQEIWVVGGDGTVKEGLQAIIDAGAVLGVVPAGTSNCLARELGTPPETEAAVEWLLARPIGRADLGRCNGELFSVRVGTGVEARAAAITEGSKRGVGPFAYALAGIRALRECPPVLTTVRAQGELIYRGRAIGSITSNVALHPLLGFAGRQRVEPADGLLHITIAHDVPLWAHFADWLTGAAHGDPVLAQITEHLAPAFEIEIEGGAQAHLDGQSIGPHSRLLIECLPRHLRVRGGAGPYEDREE